ncbi:MAG: hypothetical protein LBU65_17350, partial [Planctomycetaceae bacterium]|nr:hypothetical protein [Planctomycetaceae bacterium]
DIACRFDLIRRKQLWIRLVIILSTFYAVLYCSGLVGRIVKQIYHQVYMDYIVGPVAGYLATGTFSWRILIAPALAAVIITILLYIAVKQRRKKL